MLRKISLWIGIILLVAILIDYLARATVLGFLVPENLVHANLRYLLIISLTLIGFGSPLSIIGAVIGFIFSLILVFLSGI